MPDPSRTTASPAIGMDALRAAIDGVDDALLDLVERRVRLTADMAALKADARGTLRIRPRREAEVVARVTARARHADPRMVEHLWRTLMSYGLQDQARMNLVLHAPDDRSALQAIARDRFGPAPPVRWAASERDALDAALTEEAVAVIVRDDPPDLAGTPLRVFETLREGAATAYAIGRVDPADVAAEPSA